MTYLRSSLFTTAGLIGVGFGMAGGCAKAGSLTGSTGTAGRPTSSIFNTGGTGTGGIPELTIPSAGDSPGGGSSGTTSVSCDSGLDRCGPNCVDLLTNAANCGFCSNQCPAEARACVAGTCTCPADTHAVCDGICSDLRTDMANCGSCGTFCSADRICSDGVCVCDPAKKTTMCENKCVDLLLDPKHCGACDQASSPTPDLPTVCASDQVCSDGACTAACKDPTVKCGNTCSNLQTDAANCSACGTKCDSTRICSAGSCVCATTRKLCGTTCADLQTDSKNCGACGTVCAPGTECSKGVCVCTASATQCTVTGGGGAGGAGSAGTKPTTICADLTANRDHCGACNKPCKVGESCVNSACACQEPNVACGTAKTCTDIQTSIDNCGECNKKCTATTQHCEGGACVCNAALKDCGTGACIDLTSDKANCGECGKACTGNQLCSDSLCISGDIQVKTKVTSLPTAGTKLNSVLASVQVCNSGSSTVKLGGAKIAYWYSSDTTGKEQTGSSPYSSLSGVTVTAEAVDPMRGTTDYRILVTLPTTASLNAGACFEEIQISVHDGPTWTTGYDMTNDWSYLAKTTFEANTKVTMYMGTAKMWGTEPPTS